MKNGSITTRFIFLLLLFKAILVSAQSTATYETPKEDVDIIGELSVDGSVDVYFHDTIDTNEDAPRTAFANLRGFSLGMINLIVSYKGKKSGLVADMVYGPRGSDAVFNASQYTNSAGNSTAHIINQMYAYYQFSDKVIINFGQFNTFLGYEVISPIPNFHYSTSYLFSYGPFSHTGLRTDLDFGEGWIGKLSVMNPTDFTEYNPFDTYTLGGQLGYVKDAGSVYLNITSGDQDGSLKKTDSINSVSSGNTFQVDITTGLAISTKYYLGINASYQGIGAGEVMTDNGITGALSDTYGFYGAAIYQRYDASEAFAMGLRTEIFSEFKGGLGAIGGYDANGNGNITEITLSGNYVRGGLRIIPEFRLDIGSEETFTKKSNGIASNIMASLNVAVVYVIPSVKYKIQSKN